MSEFDDGLVAPALHSAHSRRSFLDLMVRVGLTGATATAVLGGFPDAAMAATQDSWRFCNKCHGLFFNGYPNKGRCPAGGGHVAQGYNFVLPYAVSESPQAQGAWRFCAKCQIMFFDGYPQKGVCPGGGGHAAAGYVFVLPHDVRVSGLNQGAWRFCNRCDAMFYDGYSNKGRCPAGGGHVAQGYNFVLRFRGNLEDDVVLNPVHE
jgi:hypothetical protein